MRLLQVLGKKSEAIKKIAPQPLFEKQMNNQTQINTLSNLRDKLLSKLMSNELIIE